MRSPTGEHLVIDWHGETVVDAPATPSPTRARCTSARFARPDTQDALIADTTANLKRPETADELKATLLKMISSPALCSRKWITEQYDRYVRGNTVLAENADGGVVRIDEETGRGIALATDASGRYTMLDPTPLRSSRWPRRTANVAVTGGDPEGRFQLPQLRFAGGSGCHVAVPAGRARPGGRLRAARYPGHGRQRQFLQPDGFAAILPTPVVRRPRCDRRRATVVSRPAWASSPVRR